MLTFIVRKDGIQVNLGKVMMLLASNWWGAIEYVMGYQFERFTNNVFVRIDE